MRDILLFAIVFLSLPVILARPYVGALMWVWISMMNPHRLTYGIAYSFPSAMVIAITTMLAWVMSPQRKPLPINAITVVMLAFIAWMSFTSLFALQPPQVVFESWSQVMKTQLMILLTLMLVRGRRQIDQLIWVIVLSLGYYGVKGGIFTVITGGYDRVWGPPGSFIEGNNELGLALSMLLPLMYYLAETSGRRLVRIAMWVAMALCGFGILGTHSRGALLAICAAALFLGLKSRRPLLTTMLFAVVLAGVVAFMPDNWTARMNTIETFDTDRSAMSRLETWRVIWNMALSRPIVGAGFNLDNPTLFATYGVLPDQEVFTAHSIYFQALGEHGFVGLGLLLLLGVVVWLRSRKLVASLTGRPDLEWAHLLVRMVQVSLLVFGVGGAFLGLLHFDLPYYLGALVVLAEVAIKEALARDPAQVPSVGLTPAEARSV